jgi:hypothetical protein
MSGVGGRTVMIAAVDAVIETDDAEVAWDPDLLGTVRRLD